MKINILNKKAVKQILALIKSQWNAKLDLDYAFLQDKEGKIYLITKDFAELPLEKLRLNKLGLYFGKIESNELRLSIEGSQLVGPNAKKNILEITKEQTRQWLRGEEIKTEEKLKGFVILKHNKDFFGTGKIKNGYVLNYVPKGRRIKSSD